MYYGDKQRSLVNISTALQARGWKIYGFHASESDIYTDYFDPASWDGVATKNGITACFDISSYTVKEYSGKQETAYTEATELNYNSTKKINQLKALANDQAATDGEKVAALEAIERIKKSVEQKHISAEQTKKVIAQWPTFQMNPGHCNWHVEKDGKILDKGIGAFQFYDLPGDYDISTGKCTGQYRINYQTNEKKTTFTDKEQTEIDKFEKFINRIDAISNAAIGMDDGTKQGKTAAEKQAKSGFHKTMITEYKNENKVERISTPEHIETGMYFILNSNFNYGRVKGSVFKITDNHVNKFNKETYIEGQRLNHKHNKVLTGTATRANSFSCMADKFNKWLADGSISICVITEVKVPHQVEKWVRDEPKHYNRPAPEQNTTDLKYDIQPDIDTRNNSPIFTVKIKNKLSREQYAEVNTNMRSLGGYYSRFKHSFIFKDDPSEKLGVKQNININETAEQIIDSSTDIITELHLAPEIYVNSTEYREKLDDYITSHDIVITDSIINYIKKNYAGLASILESLKAYQQPKIEKGYIYSAHFKQWNTSIEDIEKECAIPHEWAMDKICFTDITAEQTQQAKTISDKNGSIFFIDEKKPITKKENAFSIPYEYTITKGDDGSNILQLSETLTKTQFKELQNTLRRYGGFYSRYRKGFVFKELPELSA